MLYLTSASVYIYCRNWNFLIQLYVVYVVLDVTRTISGHFLVKAAQQFHEYQLVKVGR